MKKSAFTLAEVLITLAIIGVVAAMAIPGVISNAQQQEFKTGLKKAVSVLNSAITMNIALEGESPYDNGDLFNYLQRHMSVMKSSMFTPWSFCVNYPDGTRLGWGMAPDNTTYNNAIFYTTDGMRYEFFWADDENQNSESDCGSCAPLHENSSFHANIITTKLENQSLKLSCGSYGLMQNPNNTTSRPCKILVDVNGDRKPYPSNVNETSTEYRNPIILPNPTGNKLKDTFTILITEDRAIPYGVLAQKAMYQAQK